MHTQDRRKIEQEVKREEAKIENKTLKEEKKDDENN
mgnify:CR=1 FL=1